MRSRLRVLEQVLRNRRLRRVECAFLGFGCAEFGVWLAILVYAYQHGGTTTAAILAAAQLVPAAIVAPLAARLSERFSPALVLRLSYLLQAGLVLCTSAVFLSGLPSGLGYVGAVLAASAVTLTRPAQGSLLPTLVQTPRELTAANAVSGWVESISVLLGPVLAGVLLAADGPGLALMVFGVVLLAGWMSLAGLERSSEAGVEGPRGDSSLDGSDDQALVIDRGIAGTLVLFLVQFIAWGALDVIVVVLAIHVLGIGASGAGYLQGAFGAGAVLGGFAAVMLVGRRSVVGPLLGAGAIWGGMLILLAGWRSAAVAFVLLCIAGTSRTIFDVSGRTLLHRAVPPGAHGRAFGLVESVAMLGLACGSLAVPLLIHLGGIHTALLALGALLVIACVGLLGVLVGTDTLPPAPAEELDLLRSSPLFSPLSTPVLEDLARTLLVRNAGPGEVIIRQGDRGDEFFLVRSGELDVFVEDDWIRTLHPGDGFGEIALLRDGQRTATVVARDPVELLALTRAWFLEAVTGSRQAHRVAEELVVARLAG